MIRETIRIIAAALFNQNSRAVLRQQRKKDEKAKQDGKGPWVLQPNIGQIEQPQGQSLRAEIFVSHSGTSIAELEAVRYQTKGQEQEKKRNQYENKSSPLQRTSR